MQGTTSSRRCTRGRYFVRAAAIDAVAGWWVERHNMTFSQLIDVRTAEKLVLELGEGTEDERTRLDDLRRVAVLVPKRHLGG